MTYYINSMPVIPYLEHHGILGQKWGKRNGPPYPLKGGSYSKSEVIAIYKESKNKNSIYNKKHFDKVLNKDSSISTLSYDKNRTKNTDMFYATYTKHDKNLYNALFNKKIPQTLYDENNSEIGTGNYYKYKIDNKVNKDLRIASEDSAAKVFKNLYENNRDFYNFVIDPKRMQSHFVESKYKFKGYREARDTLEKMRKTEYEITEKDLDTIYRIFNYVIPSDGSGNSKRAKDIAVNRQKFFNALNKSGYDGLLDTNDAIYGGFKANAPIIVFNIDKVALIKAERTTMGSKVFSEIAYIGSKILGA